MTEPMEPPLVHPDDALFEASTSAAAAAVADSGPPPSSKPPGAFQEPPGRPGSAPSAPTEDHRTAPVAFNEQYRLPFEGLIWIGYLEETFDVWGHSFRITTPSRMERLQAGVLQAPYLNTLSAELAYETVLVAAFLTEVDGQQLPRPVVNDPSVNAVQDRFKWVAENLKEPVIARVYERVLLLDEQVRGVVASMGEA